MKFLLRFNKPHFNFFCALILLQTNETLKSLDLAWNSFGYKGAMALSMNLLSNENLKHLDLRFVLVLFPFNTFLFDTKSFLSI